MVLSETRAKTRPMAWLSYPREHMVPRETWRQRRTQPNPAWILTLEPERLEPMNSRGSDSGPPFGLGALKRLVTSDTQGRKLLFLPHMQSDGCHLARQRQPRHLRSHPLPQKVFVERAKGSVAAAGAGGRALKQVFQIVVVVQVQAANEQRLFAALQLTVHHLIVGAAAGLQGQAAVGPELPLAAEAVRRLHAPDQQGGAYRTEPRNGAQPLRLVVLATLQNQIPAGFAAQLL